MRVWALAWASGPVQEVGADCWALRPHKMYLGFVFGFSKKKLGNVSL